MRFYNLPEIGDEVLVGIVVPTLGGGSKENGFLSRLSFAAPVGSDKGSRSARNEIAIETLE